MRPTPIPDELVPPGMRRLVIAAPDGDLLNPDVAPVEALVSERNGQRVFATRWQLESGDLEMLTAGGYVWLCVMAPQLPPVSLDVMLPAGGA